MGSGLLLAVLTGIIPLLGGGAFLESGWVELEILLVGKVKLVSALAFDTGVYLVVVGIVHTIVLALGNPEPR